MTESIQILSQFQLSKTASRIKILDLFISQPETISLPDIEESFPDLDRITVYRTLKVFEHKGIIHRAIDGTTHPKYALCAAGCSEHRHQDNHAHFHCVSCAKTVCVDEIDLPQIKKLPSGFKLLDSHLILNGECADCSGGS